MDEKRKDCAKNRYDEKRPVISVRVSEAQKSRVEEMARASQTSVGRLVREALTLEVRERRETYKSGYEKGRREAFDECLVTVPCTCGHSFSVIGEERIREVEDLLAVYCNWYHKSCRPEEVPKPECRLFKDRKRGRE